MSYDGWDDLKEDFQEDNEDDWDTISENIEQKKEPEKPTRLEEHIKKYELSISGMTPEEASKSIWNDKRWSINTDIAPVYETISKDAPPERIIKSTESIESDTSRAEEIEASWDELSSDIEDEDGFEKKTEEIDADKLEDNIASENTAEEELEEIKRLEQEYLKREFPENTLLPFVEPISFADSSFQATPIIHDFIITEESEYDMFPSPHYSFISDFFPVNNMDVNRLVRGLKKLDPHMTDLLGDELNKYDDVTIVEIYKRWLLYLKSYQQDYHQYDLINFNDSGEFIGRNDLKHVDKWLDMFIDTVKDKHTTTMFDEAKDKREREEQFKEKVQRIIKSGTYVSDIDPDFGKQT